MPARAALAVTVAGAVVAVLACGAPAKPADAPAPTSTTPPPKRDLAVAEPVPKRPTPPEAEPDPRDPSALVRAGRRSNGVVIERRVGQPQVLDFAEADMWSPCVRDFVQAQSEAARRALTAAFRRYGVSCDVDGRVRVSAPGRGASHLGIGGTLTVDRSDLSMYAAACESSSASIDQMVIVYDGKRWSSGRALEERRDSCNVVAVPNGRSVRRMLRDVVDANDVVVHFEGTDVPEDVVVTDDMKRDLRLMLDALDALSGP